jgi:hypothetical protein
MDVRAQPFAVNRDARVERTQRTANANDSRARNGERARAGVARISEDDVPFAAALFRYETFPAAFAAQVVAQAMKTPRATALESAIAYREPAPDGARLIAFA